VTTLRRSNDASEATRRARHTELRSTIAPEEIEEAAAAGIEHLREELEREVAERRGGVSWDDAD